MLKLRRYLKPFAVSILAIIALLFAQAMCELTMPDYMSNIVNVGINANGIEDGVPEAIRESEIERLAIFLDEEQQQLIEDHYEKVSPADADSEQLSRYPLLAEETLYILQPVTADQREQLNLALSDAELCVSGITQMESTLRAAMDDPQQAEAAMPWAKAAPIPPTRSMSEVSMRRSAWTWMPFSIHICLSMAH